MTPCPHRARRQVIAGTRTAYTCNRPRCIGQAIKWATRHSDHALIETIKEDQ